jgi:D-glycero-alpha-D-manno-heptose 1-phosphate guanylyltransferase
VPARQQGGISTNGSEAIPEEAVILAGGLGKRLRQIVPDLPKPMAPVGDRPFLAHLLTTLAQQGVRRIVLSVGYKSEIFVNYFGNDFNGVELVYAVEEQPMGTAGGIRLGLEMVHGNRAFILNGDTLFNVSLARLAKTFATHHAKVVMAVRPMVDCARYGAVDIKDERITGFQEKGRHGAGLINGGVFLLSTSLQHDLLDCFSFENDFLQPNINRMVMAAVVSDGFFIDIGVPEDYAAAQTLLVNQPQQVFV